MSNDCVSRYKISRKTAGLTQEQAADLLGVAPRTLCDYENGHAKVPDDIVAKMAEIYNCPLLAWWHLKRHSPLGKFLPEIQMPQTNGDMAFQLITAQDDLQPIVETVKQIMRGELCEGKKADLQQEVENIRQVKSMLLSTIIYARQLLDTAGKGDADD